MNLEEKELVLITNKARNFGVNWLENKISAKIILDKNLNEFKIQNLDDIFKILDEIKKEAQLSS